MRRSGSCGGPRSRCISVLAILVSALALPAAPQRDLSELYAEAQQAQASGDLGTATRRYEAIVQQQPRMAEAYANLGNLYYQQKQTERAKAAYRKAIEQKPELTGPHFFLGVIAFGEHDYSLALEHLGKAAGAPSPNPLIYAYLGYTRFARSEFGEAASSLEKANALNGTDIDVLYHLSKSYSHLAERAFAQLETQFPDSVYVMLARAHLAEGADDWAEASKQYGLALEKMPENARLREKSKWSAAKAAGKAVAPADVTRDELIDASAIYQDTPPAGVKLAEEIAQWQAKLSSFASSGKSDRERYLTGEGYQALAYLTSIEVFALDRDSYRAHELRAQMLEASNNDDGAIEEYREALKAKPDLQNIHFAIGTLFWKDHRLDDAWPELQKEIKINPHHAQAFYELGDICAFTEKSAEAEKYFLEAVTLEPGMAEAHYALEKIYTGSGRYDKSLDQLQSALKLNPSEPTTHYRLAVVYRKLGRPQEAERELALFDGSKAQAAAAHSGSSSVK